MRFLSWDRTWACAAGCAVLLGAGWPMGAASAKAAVQAIRPETYVDPYKDGLYSTIVAVISIGAPQIKKQKKVNLKIKGFKKKLPVRLILQERPAPLVVVLVGVDGKANQPLGRWFPYLLDKYLHYNVLTFDSTFRPTFADKSRFGVTGNIPVECGLIGKIIAETLQQKGVREKVTKIGVLGYSLGGTQAMTLARMAEDGRLPFKLEGALALSPPIKLKSTARILDDFYRKDRWKTTVVKMALQLVNHRPVPPGSKIPFEPWLMRGAIGYLIREEFTEIVDRNDYLFRLRQLPFDDEAAAGVNRREIARAWGFERFMEKMAFPYWKKKGAVKTIDELWSGGDLTRIMSKLPPYARAIICEDDPFQRKEDWAALKKSVPAKNLILLPHGGHIGYIASRWNFIQMARMFRFQ